MILDWNVSKTIFRAISFRRINYHCNSHWFCFEIIFSNFSFKIENHFSARCAWVCGWCVHSDTYRRAQSSNPFVISRIPWDGFVLSNRLNSVGILAAFGVLFRLPFPRPPFLPRPLFPSASRRFRSVSSELWAARISATNSSSVFGQSSNRASNRLVFRANFFIQCSVILESEPNVVSNLKKYQLRVKSKVDGHGSKWTVRGGSTRRSKGTKIEASTVVVMYESWPSKGFKWTVFESKRSSNPKVDDPKGGENNQAVVNKKYFVITYHSLANLRNFKTFRTGEFFGTRAASSEPSRIANVKTFWESFIVGSIFRIWRVFSLLQK